MARKFKQKKNKKKHNKLGLFMAIFFALIMITSIAGFITGTYSGGSQTGDVVTEEEYNGFTFSLEEEGWKTTVNNREISFVYLPTHVAFISLDQPTIQLLQEMQAAYMTFDPREEPLQAKALATFTVSEALRKTGTKHSQTGTVVEDESNLPQITCANATTTVPVIKFESGNATEIRKEGNCVIAEGSSASDFHYLATRIAYTSIGVMTS